MQRRRRRGRSGDGGGERVHDARGAVRREEAAPVEGRQAVGKERLCKVEERKEQSLHNQFVICRKCIESMKTHREMRKAN